MIFIDKSIINKAILKFVIKFITKFYFMNNYFYQENSLVNIILLMNSFHQ